MRRSTRCGIAAALLALVILALVGPARTDAQVTDKMVAPKAKPDTPRKPRVERTTSTGSIERTVPESTAPLASDKGAETAPRPPLKGRRALTAFKTAPFPYEGALPYEERPFLDQDVEGRRGRLLPHTDKILWQDETHSDDRVLLYIPRDFSPTEPALIVLFFHGHDARLIRDVERRQAVLHQVEQSGLNAVLVAPHFARDAADSSAGKFWQPGTAAAFLEEAALQLSFLGGKRLLAPLKRAPVVLIAYSGGYAPAAWTLHHGGIDDRITGVVMLDGMYGEYQKFADWMDRRRDAFFVSAYGPSAQNGNMELRRLLADRDYRKVSALRGRLDPGSITFVATSTELSHQDFVTRAWTGDPVTDVLARLPQFTRRVR